MKIKPRSIRTKMLVMLLFVSILPIGIFGFFSIKDSKEALEKEIIDKITLFSETKEGQIYGYIEFLETRTIDFSSDGYIRERVREINETGSEKAVKDLNDHLVRNKLSLDPDMIGILILNKEGIVIAATDEDEIGEDESDDEYFEEGVGGVFVAEAMGSNDNHFGEVHAIVSADPLTDKDTGEQLGVIINFFNTSKLEAVLSGEFQVQRGALTAVRSKEKTLETYLVNKDKVMLVFPKRIDERDELESKELMVVDTLPVNSCIDNNEEIVGTYLNYANEKVIGSTMCLARSGWILVTEVSSEEAMMPITRMQQRLIYVGLGSFLLVVILAVVFSWTFSSPIKKLQKATEAMASGDLKYKVSIKTGDEIEKLANSFNQIGKKLKDLYANLEKKISDQTSQMTKQLAEIEEKNKFLEDSRGATLNILEDSQKLQIQLKDEKEGVELKVQERTSELKEEQDRLFKFLETIPQGIFVLDANGKARFANKKALSLLGDQIMTTSSANFAKTYGAYLAGTNEQYPQNKMPLIVALSGKASTVRDMEIIKDGVRVPIEASAAPIYDSNKKIAFSVATFKDITEEIALSRSRDEFFSIASHELRTPLTAIRGNTSLIKEHYADEIKSEGFREMINDIHESSVRLIEIVNDFLDTSRLEMHKMEFNKSVIDLSSIISEVIKVYSVTTSRKKIYLRLEKSPKMPTVVADKNKFKQVLINLIGNAMKFTKEGGISISLKNEGKFVKILVSDTGIGIPEKNQKLLFRKFQQAESNIFTRDATRGTGLGLYISKLLIEGMGGMLNIERSVVGKGTSFFIILPFATKESIDAAQREVAKIQVDFNNGPSYNTNKATTRASKMQSVVEPAVKASATKSVTATESKKPTQNLQNEKKSTGRTTTKSSVDTSKKKIIK